jgi:hypothetical protein
MNASIETDFQRELAEIEAESMGWIPLDEGVYLHVGDTNVAEVLVVDMVIPMCKAFEAAWSKMPS